jgi:hypothetical protein
MKCSVRSLFYEINYRPQWGNKYGALLNVSKSADGWCGNACDCILANTLEMQKANMAGSGIQLGLAPVAISSIAASTDMLAILGRQRPLLGLLISAGSGSMDVDRRFALDNPTTCLSAASSSMFVGTFNRKVSFAVIGFLEYGIAITSDVNIIYASYSVSQRSGVTWSCPNWGWVMG